MEVLQDMAQREEMAGSQAEGARRAEGGQDCGHQEEAPDKGNLFYCWGNWDV